MTTSRQHEHRPIIRGPYGRWTLEVLCSWELVGLFTGWIPPISRVVQPRQRTWQMRVIVLGALGVLTHHLLVETPTQRR